MLGKIFAGITLSSTIYALCTGRMQELSLAIPAGCADAVTITLGMLGLMCLFSGVLQVLRKVGVLRLCARVLRPFLRFAFPASYHCEELSAALAANALGMGNAATPFALAALPHMVHRHRPDTASDDMITFAVLSTVPFTLLPASLIALRHAAGCADAAAVLVPIWLVSLPTALFAILLCRLLARCFPAP